MSHLERAYYDLDGRLPVRITQEEFAARNLSYRELDRVTTKYGYVKLIFVGDVAVFGPPGSLVDDRPNFRVMADIDQDTLNFRKWDDAEAHMASILAHKRKREAEYDDHLASFEGRAVHMSPRMREATQTFSKEMHPWLVNNVTQGWELKDSDFGMFFLFKSAEDAFHFKMKWG